MRGLVPVLALAEQIGSAQLVEDGVKIKDADNSAGANPGAKVMSPAPKALDVLAHGVRIPVLGRYRRPIETLRGWPAVAELLPRYPAIHDRSNGRPLGGAARIMGDGSMARTPGTLYPHELPLE